ncbi:replication protein A 70 kDa DNA-binding subunit, partial [Striga asiatica]
MNDSDPKGLRPQNFVAAEVNEITDPFLVLGPRYVDYDVLSDLKLLARFKRHVTNLNLLKYVFVRADAYVTLCWEFYTTFKLEEKYTIVRCRLNNKPVEITFKLMNELFGFSFEGPTSVVKARPVTARELIHAELASNRYDFKPHHDRKCVKAYIERMEVYQKGQVATNAEQIDHEVLISSEHQPEATEHQEPITEKSTDVLEGQPNSGETPHPEEPLGTASTTPCPPPPTGPSTTTDYGNQ